MTAVEDQLREATPASAEMYRRALEVFPGGLAAGTMASSVHPTYVERAEGCFLYDLDGRRIVDFMNTAHSLPFGHGFAPTVDAMREQLERGLHFTLPNRRAIEYAELLCERIPSFERVRFTCSGSEATMYAMRLARAFTGRERIARVRSCYHGTHDGVCMGTSQFMALPVPGTEGDEAIGWGVPRALADTAAWADFNDIDGMADVMSRHDGEVAAIIVEPILGGGGHIAPEPGYLQGLRDLADRHGALLIFDEMISVTVSRGGAQGLYGVTPDLTTTGKGIAGGLPVGVFGGRRDVMALCEARGSFAPVMATSTFAGHPVVMAGGFATLSHLTPDVYEHLAALGERLRAGLRGAIARQGVQLQVTGDRHLVGIHPSDRPVRRPSDATGDPATKGRIAQAMLNEGYNVPGGRASVTMAHTPELVDGFIEAFEKVIADPEVVS